MTVETRSQAVAELRAAATDIAPLALGVIVYGLAFGLLAAQAGMGGLQVGIMGTLVFAGSAQIIAVERIAAGAGAAAAMAAGIAVNLRLFLITASVREIYAGRPWWQVLLGAHMATDENWAMMVAERHKSRDVSYWYLVGSGLVLLASWLGSGTAGVLFASAIPEPRALGMDFAFTAAFIAISRSLWRGLSDLLPWSVAIAVVAVSVLTGLIDASWAIMLGGVSGAATAGLVRHV